MLQDLKILGIPEIPESGTSAMTKAEVYNAQLGSLGESNCPLCRNRGYIAAEEDGMFRLQECECMGKRRALRRIRRSGLADLLEEYTFEAYQTPRQWQAAALQKAKDYAVNGAGRWMYVCGKPGTGKTHLCTAVVGQLIAVGKEARYMLWREEAPQLKAMVNEREYYNRVMGELIRAPVLYIDDFLKGCVSQADVNLAFELLNARYNSRHTMTLLSSERTVEELLDMDEALGSRIYERAKGYTIKAEPENWRLRR